ncbi:LON peptidase substrate-binding domain-containing protein [bacterium]|nr:LON peptidase substrate-binding domain-containing protein [bacterium]MDA7887587.1 LON peptidase substrate-binding domain-containing protein [bacterium]MDA7926276.1 LON peptidase substrate-binding domain-containing protein [Mariniblastus sp.]MDB4368447.1 LON peptidase substrate-binding domain-containing protein [Mariniblastus sp.]MDB4460718.1 LON peptidase substrate-binding domain-containing protein [bacterium]
MGSPIKSEHSLPEDFGNVVRLFPLPNVVLFPGIVQALQLFEPRYKSLAEDAIESDQLITIGLIDSQWKTEQSDVPSIAKTVCIGRVLSHTKLEDGRYNIFLVGVSRAEVVSELVTETPYRMAEVRLIEEQLIEDHELSVLRTEVCAKFRKLASYRTGWHQDALDQFLGEDLPLGQLIDMVCYSCGAGIPEQQLVLETVDLAERGNVVLEILNGQIRASESEQSSTQDFPPSFSLN